MSLSAEPAPPPAESAAAGRIVGRNMLALVLSQFVTTPVSMVVNAMLARRLGASNFGAIYLATTALALAFIIVDWGGQGQVAAEIARDRSAAAKVLGTGILVRLVIGAAVLLALPAIATLMRYDSAARLALAILGFRFAIASLGNLCNAVLRGFEKIDWQARATVAGNLIEATLVIGTLLAGGGLRGALLAQVAGVSLALCLQAALVARLRIGRPGVDTAAARVLLAGGFGFLFLDLVLKMQPYIDSAFLSRLARPEALGWYGAATRITGVLIFPAVTLNMALYPTLARLWTQDRATYETMMRVGLRSVIVLGVLAATGTAIFAPLIVRIVYGGGAYAPTALNLAILSPYVLLVYSSVVLGAGIAASEKQVRWAAAQSLCLVVSVALDPILIPWAEARYGNGSVGVCISVAVAEVAMVTMGMRILPVPFRNLSLATTVARSLVAGAAMGLVGAVFRPVPALAIPGTVLAYGGVLWAQREIDGEMLALLRTALSSKFSKSRGAATPEPAAAVDLGT